MLETRTSKNISRIVMIRCVISPTKPTPLVSANRAGHVVTPWLFSYKHVAFFALSDGLFLHPFVQLLINGIFTGLKLMIHPSTLSAYSRLTFWANNFAFNLLWDSYYSLTFFIWTPCEIWIAANFFVKSELLEFLVHFQLKEILKEFITQF